jgi:hypothetical protein
MIHVEVWHPMTPSVDGLRRLVPSYGVPRLDVIDKGSRQRIRGECSPPPPLTMRAPQGLHPVRAGGHDEAMIPKRRTQCTRFDTVRACFATDPHVSVSIYRLRWTKQPESGTRFYRASRVQCASGDGDRFCHNSWIVLMGRSGGSGGVLGGARQEAEENGVGRVGVWPARGGATEATATGARAVGMSVDQYRRITPTTTPWMSSRFGST